MEPPVPVYFHLLKDSQDSAPLLKLSKLPHPPPATTLLSCFSSSRAIYCLKLFPHHLLSQFTKAHHKPLQVAAGWPTCQGALPARPAAPAPASSQRCPPALAQPVPMGCTALGQAHAHPAQRMGTDESTTPCSHLWIPSQQHVDTGLYSSILDLQGSS